MLYNLTINRWFFLPELTYALEIDSNNVEFVQFQFVDWWFVNGLWHYKIVLRSEYLLVVESVTNKACLLLIIHGLTASSCNRRTHRCSLVLSRKSPQGDIKAECKRPLFQSILTFVSLLTNSGPCSSFVWISVNYKDYPWNTHQQLKMVRTCVTFHTNRLMQLRLNFWEDPNNRKSGLTVVKVIISRPGYRRGKVHGILNFSCEQRIESIDFEDMCNPPARSSYLERLTISAINWFVIGPLSVSPSDYQLPRPINFRPKSSSQLIINYYCPINYRNLRHFSINKMLTLTLT